MSLQLAIKFVELLLADHAIFRPIQTRAFVVQRVDCVGPGCKMDTRSLPQTMQEVLAIIGRDNIVDDRLTISIYGNSSLTFVTSDTPQPLKRPGFS